jgi:hypothetical protein
VFEYVLGKGVAPSSRIVDISGLGKNFYQEVDQIDIIATPALSGFGAGCAGPSGGRWK